MVLPYDQQFMARRSIVTAWNIAQSAVVNIQALYDGEAKRPRALDDTTTHISYAAHAERFSTGL